MSMSDIREELKDAQKDLEVQVKHEAKESSMKAFYAIKSQQQKKAETQKNVIEVNKIGEKQIESSEQTGPVKGEEHATLYQEHQALLDSASPIPVSVNHDLGFDENDYIASGHSF